MEKDSYRFVFLFFCFFILKIKNQKRGISLNVRRAHEWKLGITITVLFSFQILL